MSQNKQSNKEQKDIQQKQKLKQQFIKKQDELNNEQKQYLGSQKNDQIINSQTFFCKICQYFLVHSVTTACNHSFCQLCINQYMLYLDECPLCSHKIRNQKLSNNIIIDTLILDYIRKFQKDQLETYQQKLQEFKKYQKDRKINQLGTGDKLDIRDSDYVWCTGRIHRIVNKFNEKKIKCFIIKYDKSNKKQQLPQNSPRIAPLGYFTNRQDIPKYIHGKLVLKSQQQKTIYTIPNYYKVDQVKEQSLKVQN